MQLVIEFHVTRYIVGVSVAADVESMRMQVCYGIRHIIDESENISLAVVNPNDRTGRRTCSSRDLAIAKVTAGSATKLQLATKIIRLCAKNTVRVPCKSI